MLHFNLMPVMVLAFLGSTQCSQPSVNDFQIYAQLEEALINYDYNLFVLSQTFYPSTGSGPICIPVKYSLDCENSSYSNSSNSSNSSYSEFFLWTLYDVNKPAGRLLLTQNFIGISLRGFAWEEHCFLHNPIELRLNVCSLNLTEDEPSILHALKEITAVVRFYYKLVLSLGFPLWIISATLSGGKPGMFRQMMSHKDCDVSRFDIAACQCIVL